MEPVKRSSARFDPRIPVSPMPSGRSHSLPQAKCVACGRRVREHLATRVGMPGLVEGFVCDRCVFLVALRVISPEGALQPV